MAAKGLLLALVGTVGVFLLSAIAILLAGLVADPERHADLGLSTAGGTVACVAFTSAAAVLLALGIGALARSTAVAVGVIVTWHGIGEATVARLPGLGEHLAPFLPLANGALGMTGKAPPGVDFPWGQLGGLAYFVGFSIVVFLAGVRAIERRDA